MGTTRTRRTPVPPVEPTDDVAPLVDGAEYASGGLVSPSDSWRVHGEMEGGGSAFMPLAQSRPTPELPTRFVVAFHKGLGAHAVMARTALEDWDGWEAVEDLPDGEPPLLPARFTAQAD